MKEWIKNKDKDIPKLSRIFFNKNILKASIYFSWKQMPLSSFTFFICSCRQLLDEWNILQLPNKKQILLVRILRLKTNSLKDTNSWSQAICANIWLILQKGCKKIYEVILKSWDFSWLRTSFSQGGSNSLYRHTDLS